MEDLTTMSGIIDNALLKVNVRKFSTAAMTSWHSKQWYELMRHFDRTNNTGVFVIINKRKLYYLFMERNKQVLYPAPLNAAWKENVVNMAEAILIIPVTR